MPCRLQSNYSCTAGQKCYVPLGRHLVVKCGDNFGRRCVGCVRVFLCYTVYVSLAGDSGLGGNIPDFRTIGSYSSILPMTVVFIASASAIYSLGHKLRTLTAVPI